MSSTCPMAMAGCLKKNFCAPLAGLPMSRYRIAETLRSLQISEWSATQKCPVLNRGLRNAAPRVGRRAGSAAVAPKPNLWLAMTLFGKKTEPQPPAAEPETPASPQPEAAATRPLPLTTASEAKDFIRDQIFLRVDPLVAVRISKTELTSFVNKLVAEIANDRKILLNQLEQHSLVASLVDEMVGLGPIESLLRDPSVSDILVNGSRTIYVERHGKLELAKLQFRSDAQVLHVAQRIASSIGRRVDESSPMLDARLADGSRVNVIIPPLALKGPCISIRKFSKNLMEFSNFVTNGTISSELASFLEICARCRLNIIISGGTGSGKTTLLNALSSTIDPRERIITIEDAAELQLQQAHVISLETRPPKRRRARRDHAAGSYAQRASDASRPDHRRRGSRAEGVRHAASHEHGTQWLHVDGSLQLRP